MTTPEINVWVPAASALAGVLAGSLTPIVVGLLNARSESRRERLRLAVQMALDENKAMMDQARVKAESTGFTVGVPPISATLAYHAEVLELLERAGRLEPEDLVALRARAKAMFEALAGAMPKAD